MILILKIAVIGIVSTIIVVCLLVVLMIVLDDWKYRKHIDGRAK